MKKMIFSLIFASICAISVFNVQAMLEKMKDKEDLINYFQMIKNTTIDQPASMVKKWHDLKAQELRAEIAEIIKLSAQIKDPKIKAEWNNLLQTMSKLLVEIETLSVPAEGFKKSLAGKIDWLKLEAKKLSLLAEQLRIIGQQTGSEAALRIADMKERKATFLKGVIEAVMAGKAMYGAAKMASQVRERLDDMRSGDLADAEDVEFEDTEIM